MVDKATNEFWRDLKPIANAFKPHALPEAFIANAASEDERLYVPFPKPCRRARCGSRRRRTSGATS